jgi:beta-lactamase regulating signal transducer with metallopeptidase domain/HEAT repeat protein
MTIVESVGWVLLHFIWQGGVIALSLAGLLAVTPEAKARLRYALSCAALALMLVAALATAATLLTVGADEAAQAASVRGAGTSGTDLTPTAAPDPRTGKPAHPSPTDVTTDAGTGAIATRVLRPVVTAAMPWLVTGWVIGVLVLSVRLLGGWRRTRTLRVAGVSAVPDWCEAQFGALVARMRITRPVAIVSSIRITVPVVLGHLRPVIVLPAAALAGLSPSQLEAILAHELAHVRRHDYVVNLAQTVIETLLFYHPAVWWVSRQVRVAREHCCDDVAVAVCRSRQDYVHALLDLEELRGSSALLALGATDGSLLARGRRLLAPQQGRETSARLAAGVIALTVVAATVTGASFESTVVPPPDREPSLPAVSISEDEDGHAAAVRAPEPGQGPAVPVVTAPATGGTLSSRWSWAERAARDARHARYWIGYSVAPVKGLPPFVYIDRLSSVLADRITLNGSIFSDNVAGLRFAGRRLDVTGGHREVKLLFELETTRAAAALRAVHTSTLSLPVETRNLPIFWLGPADPAQSLERIDAWYRTIASPELKHDLVAAAGVHDASSAVVAWLERRVASQDADDVRGDAVEWIAWHPIAASVTALDRIARTDRSSHVRQEAAEALGDLAMPEAAPVLITLARTLQDQDARREAVEALGARPELEARDALASIATEDASLDIQREAVETLGDFEDKRGVPPLIELARTHPSVEVRREAVETLGDALPTETAVPLLEQIVMRDPDPQVQEEAVDTMAGIEHAQSLAALKELARSHASASVRREAVEALADRAAHRDEGQPSPDRAAIVELLATLARTDRDTEVQIEAVETLGEVHDPSAVARLRDLAGTHPAEQVRAEALETLGESGAPAAETADFLRRVAVSDTSTHVRDEAFETLAELPDAAGINALVELAREHPVPAARRQALEALLESDHPAARAVFERALQKPSGR